MDAFVRDIIGICWGIFFVVWVLAALFTKRTVQRESGAQRLRYMVLIIIGSYLVFGRHPLPRLFHLRLIPQNDEVLVSSAFLCVCGLVFFLGARAVLGRNWSG